MSELSIFEKYAKLPDEEYNKLITKLRQSGSLRFADAIEATRKRMITND
ncbi:hypothetical protein MKY91_20540 [Alkalicoccobacillus gibsonii]|uniref:Uncharacterized protein n=1 Tax=Alkalicoccobacillus gibsonii TaxID=79881 RepID=A0ABU9VPN5_9BACI